MPINRTLSPKDQKTVDGWLVDLYKTEDAWIAKVKGKMKNAGMPVMHPVTLRERANKLVAEIDAKKRDEFLYRKPSPMVRRMEYSRA